MHNSLYLNLAIKIRLDRSRALRYVNQDQGGSRNWLSNTRHGEAAFASWLSVGQADIATLCISKQSVCERICISRSSKSMLDIDIERHERVEVLPHNNILNTKTKEVIYTLIYLKNSSWHLATSLSNEKVTKNLLGTTCKDIT